ncbi:hypothetical protein EMCRGX_G007983 [Ephydatia muelleri]
MSNKPGKGDASNATAGHMYVASTAGGENDDAEEIAVPNVERSNSDSTEFYLEHVAQEKGKDKCYTKIRSQLCVDDGVLCRKYTPGPLEKEKTVPVVPLSLQPTALKATHDTISSGHQGVEKTLQRLKCTAYWFEMAKDTELYCRSCMVRQRSKLPMPTLIPMTNIPIGHPWQMLTIDVLQVPTAECIPGILIDLFSRFGIPEILHSDQGANFESTMIRRAAAFGITKSRTTSFHSQGNGMVERFNRTLLQLFRCYSEENDLDWEGNLPLVLYAYRTACNASTGFSPFVLMMGRDPVQQSLPSMTNSSAQDPTSYNNNLRVNMTELRDMVLSTESRKGPEWCTLTECDAEKESTLSREVEWEPASIKHFSVPTDSTPQPEIVHEIPPAVPLPNEQFCRCSTSSAASDRYSRTSSPTYFGPGTKALPTTRTTTS